MIGSRDWSVACGGLGLVHGRELAVQGGGEVLEAGDLPAVHPLLGLGEDLPVKAP